MHAFWMVHLSCPCDNNCRSSISLYLEAMVNDNEKKSIIFEERLNECFTTNDIMWIWNMGPFEIDIYLCLLFVH